MKSDKEIEQIEKAHKYWGSLMNSILHEGNVCQIHVEDYNCLIKNIPKFRDVVNHLYLKFADLYVKGKLKYSDELLIYKALTILAVY